MDVKEVVKELNFLSNPTKKNLEGMARFGIRPRTKMLCISMPNLRKLAKKIGKDHDLAIKLWDLKIHDARILAGLIDEPDKVTEDQMEKWVNDFDSWDICDSVCGNLFDKTKFAYKKIGQWAKREEEYVKRTPFTLLAWLSVHDKKAKDEKFIKYFPIIKKAAIDDRNFVKKAVNWAIRQIGKRNKHLNKKAVKLSNEIKRINSKAARWIASNALLELTDKKIVKRIK